MFLNPYIKTEDEDFYNTVKDFAKERALPGVEERDELGTWDDSLWKEMGKMGLLGIPVPDEYGGQGGTCLHCCIAQEAFNAGCLDGGFGLSWGAHMIIGTLPILFQGTAEQKQKYLPKFVTGEWIAGLALTEPDSGSDAAGMLTFAEKVEGGYILNGSKMYITNGPVGQVFIVMARTTKSRGPMGVSAFIVESNMKGFHVSKVLKKLGHNTSTTAELSFQDMFVPDANLLGPLNSGFLRIGKATLEWERTVLVAALPGGMEFILEAGLDYSLKRRQFGKPILSFFGIQEKLARNWAYLCASRRVIYFVANKKDSDPSTSLPLESSALKVFVTESAEELANDAVQLFGGIGYMRECDVSRFYRDVKLGTIGGGTSEIQRSIISSTFSGFQKFMSTLEQAFPENIRTKAEAELAGTPEYRMLVSAKNLIQSVGDHPERKKKQSLEFGFADLLVLTMAIQLAVWDSAQSSAEYSTEDRKRDLRILSFYAGDRFLKNVHFLKEIDQRGTQDLLRCFNELPPIEKEISACIEFLKEGVLGASVS
ncbi:acyl-CoA dehydrogenase [Leptospira perolatii]|uniref:Cyclohexane-1-carbonyl-CoA dehydrogenase n=1 Tax=Leptospira perolatii TaxID=2023191 RepID=A0A2M9ZKQ1_9LEPT|nr:acyl-CoA dehydrogenase family protein [Leptospira perolatii]PJZ69946.1 acyl-CoA dehydrogenase [Leptospira perolatii]PJZ72646.1 acyl-CoA dehydrogenase [Leptospira perolatii]